MKKILFLSVLFFLTPNLSFGDILLNQCGKVLKDNSVEKLSDDHRHEYYISLNDGKVYFTYITSRATSDFLNEQVGWSGGFTQNAISGGIWKWNASTLSINNEEIALDLKYFPNPVNDKLYINYINDIDISVFDINGRKILQTNNKTIDFSDFDYGIYLLHIKDIISNNYKIIKILKE